MDSEKLSIILPDKEKCLCYKCKWSGFLPGRCSCMKYKLKPKGVLYENADCPKFVEDEEKEEE